MFGLDAGKPFIALMTRRNDDPTRLDVGHRLPRAVAVT